MTLIYLALTVDMHYCSLSVSIEEEKCVEILVEISGFMLLASKSLRYQKEETNLTFGLRSDFQGQT